MSEDELQTVTLHDNFYRDSFNKVIMLITCILAAIVLLASFSIYLYIEKPRPVTFYVNDGFRVQPKVSLEDPYVSAPDMLQWVNDVFSKVFNLDFIHYDEQLSAVRQYFTADGWRVFLNQVNNYASKDMVVNGRLFVTATPTGAPAIFRKQVLTGRYIWQVNVPLSITYTGGVSVRTNTMTLQVLVVRVPTDNNLSGLAIDNVIVLNNPNNG